MNYYERVSYDAASGEPKAIRCPYHIERTASLLVHATRFYCLGCGRTGTRKQLQRKLKAR